MNRNHRVKWAGGMSFIGTAESGHSMVIDSDKQIGASPMELLLLSVASCACVDFVMILEKGRQKLSDAWIEIGGQRREDMPKYYTHIEMHFVAKGTAIREAAVERAIELTLEKYCSASAQMAALAEIRTSYEIIED
jgi:putative redox protein